jgi:hypothetical protein
VVEGVVGDVLADPVVAAAANPDRRREACELRRDDELFALERVVVDGDREVGELVEGAQGRTRTFAWPVRQPVFDTRTA